MTVTPISKRNKSMAFYNEKEQMYLETDASGDGLEASLLQVRDGMKFLRYKPNENAALQLIAFESNSITNAETHYATQKGNP